VRPARSSSFDVLTRSEADRAALIGSLSLRADAEWLAELVIDLEEDEPARLHLIAGLRRSLGSRNDRRLSSLVGADRPNRA
jgi:hypothetical protein